MAWAGFILTGIGLIGWSVVLDVRWKFDDRLAARWVRLARRRRRVAAPLSFVISLGALAAFGIAAGIGNSLGHPLWSVLVTGPAALLYTPFMMATCPGQGGAYRWWRQSLEQAGADPSLQRAIAWSAGPPSLVGLVSLIAVMYSLFLP